MYQHFIDEGIPVIGIYPITKDGACSCGWEKCQAVGKHPYTNNWQHSPVWSDEQLETMEQSGQFDTGYGVLVKGLLVVDVDARNGGVDSFSKLEELCGIDLYSEAGLAVSTGSGGGSIHLYFRLNEELPLVQHLQGIEGIDFKSSGFVIGPESKHASGGEYSVIHGSVSEIYDAPQELIELLKKPESYRGEYKGATMDVDDSQLRDMLSHISPDCDYDQWIRVGMALHHATGGTGLHLWDSWSSNGEKYKSYQELEKHWHSFGKSTAMVTLGTLCHYAEQGGWSQPVTFTPDSSAPVSDDNSSLDISDIDLLRPPGFVGQVAKWIDSQCRHPREHLAVTAALVAVGNIAGLRYTDDIDGVTANLFAFCVAGSGTGKEAVQQAITELHRAAGIHGATHGSIKSEQEIVRNLIRNQMAAYVIDEIGILLQKISNAQSRGGAAYLDGVIGLLMSAYSKANGFMLLTGDTRDDVKRALATELAQCRKAVAENEDKSGHMQQRIPQLERALEHIDNGLEKPFLSLIGFTTPVTFDSLVTYEQATNGFIGRSLITNERETNPRARRGFRKCTIPDNIRYGLARLYNGGEYDTQSKRVEHHGERVKISTDSEAAELMNRALDWIEDEAEAHKERTGLEAIVRRGYELMAKISLILAVPSGVRTAEHVRWAFAMVKRDIDEKTRLAYANTQEKSNPGAAIAARIVNLLDPENGTSLSVIANRLRKKKDDVKPIIDKLVESDTIIEHDTGAKHRGQKVVKYYPKG